jgi:phage host-nuclease inhibitor protein Gam
MINMEEAQAEIQKLRNLIDEAHRLLIMANNSTNAEVSPSYYSQAIALLERGRLQG